MSCYKNGTCGQYAELICNQCPHTVVPKDQRPKETIIPIPLPTRPLGILEPGQAPMEQFYSESARKELALTWLNTHKMLDNSYVVCMNPDFILGFLYEYNCPNGKLAQDFLNNPDLYPELKSALTDLIQTTRNTMKAIWHEFDFEIIPPQVTSQTTALTVQNDTASKMATHMRLELKRPHDDTWSYLDLMKLQGLVTRFDTLCETVFINILAFFRNNLEVQGTGLKENIRLQKLIINLIQYNINRREIVNILIDSGYPIEDIAIALEKAARY